MDAVLNWLWQGGIVASAAWLMLRALERGAANVRYAVTWAAALVVCTLPVIPALSSVASPAAATPADGIVALPAAWWTSTVLMAALWSVWAGVHVVRLLTAVLAIRRARGRARAFPSDVESALSHWCRVRSEGRRARLLVSDSVATAAVLGWGAPIIAVAPSLATMLDADEMDRVLIHEWSHVQRRDDLANILQVVIRIFVGWHPALWWIDRQLHVEREMACDEMSVLVTGSPKSYAACLLKLATVSGTGRGLRTAPAILAPSGLRARVLKIVSRHARIAPVWSRGMAAGIVVALCVMSMLLGGLQLVAAANPGLPLIGSRTLGLSMSVQPAIATPSTPALKRQSKPSPQTTVSRVPPVQQPAEHSASSPRSQPEASAPPEPAAAPPETVRPAEPTDAAGTVVDHAVREQVAMLPAPIPAAMAPATTDGGQSPWSAAASGGAAIGKKSKDAGVATAGFFTRFARRVAGSF